MSNSSEIAPDKRLNCWEAEQFRLQLSAVIVSQYIYLTAKLNMCPIFTVQCPGAVSCSHATCASNVHQCQECMCHPSAAPAYDTYTMFSLSFHTRLHMQCRRTQTHVNTYQKEEEEEGLYPPDVLIPVGSMFIQCLGGKGITRRHAEPQM